jgi:hypothetical protein
MGRLLATLAKIPHLSMRQDIFVAEDAVEGGAADA